MDSGLRHRILPVVALLLLALLAVGTASALVWNITTVAAGSAPSLALDGNSPRISYAGPAGLEYAAWNGSAWTSQCVDANVEDGYSSLALDAAGNPRIAYYDESNADLKCAAWNGTGWEIVTVDSIGIVGLYPSLALDAAGKPRISYGSRSSSLKYAAWTGSAWAVQTVDSNAVDINDASSLAWDNSQGARISYGAGGSLKYAAWTGSAWAISEVDIVVNCLRSSLVLDSQGNPHIAFFNLEYYRLEYARSGGSIWQVETVDSSGHVGASPSLALYGDNPRIAYLDWTNGRLKYASKSGTTWSIEAIDSAEGTAAMAVAANGRPQIAYTSGGSLKLAQSVPAVRAIGIETSVSVDGGATWLDADTAPGPSVVAGRPVKWRYNVTNTGNVPLSSVWVEDSRDGVTPTAPKSALAVGESMTAYSNGTAVAGQQSCTGTAHGTSGTLDAQGSDPVYWVGFALLAVPPGPALPTDTGGVDGLYEDVNGNLRKDFADVVLYFNQMTWIANNEPISAFDYNKNERIDFADVVWLFNHL